ncbi:MAG: 2-C-methyl-D-erythritol 2,4-cyclodiphosphate synthase [Gemmatimonadales bacterium]
MPEKNDSGERQASRTLLHRTGIGYDSHRFAPVGPIILGGVTIESDSHLHGHSDADAVAHAVTDAILGACAAGDIGEMFPDTDPANSGRDSIDMLRRAVGRLNEQRTSVINIDVTVVAERPRIGPHSAEMCKVLAGALGISPDRVSVKGKTNEGMGWIGRGEGIACIAVATVATEVDNA